MRRLACLLLATAACAADSHDMGMDAGMANIPPDLPIRNYVVDHITVPTNSTEATADGMDLDGDGDIDNKLGNVIATLKGLGVDANAIVNRAIDHGDTILLASIGTTSFYQANKAAFQTFAGADPSVAPCNGTSDTVCRHHLEGGASFTALAEPKGSALLGSFAANSFVGQNGQLVVRIQLLGSQPIDLVLLGSQATLSMTNENKIADGVIAGAVSQRDIDGKVIPAVHDNLSTTVQTQCTALTSPPTCGCPSGSDGAQALSMFDKSPTDCAISLEEVQDNSLVQALLNPDVTINGARALSLGVRITAIQAVFASP